VIRNQEVAALLDRVANLLEARGESTYRIGAYRDAARQNASLSEDVSDVWHAKSRRRTC